MILIFFDVVDVNDDVVDVDDDVADVDDDECSEELVVDDEIATDISKVPFFYNSLLS